jgi:membrane protein implicated in regulation of membrane protease activity
VILLNIDPWMIWVALILIMIVAEVITIGFFPITLAVGGLIALLVSFITDVIWVQVVIFLISSIVFFMFLKPLVEKLFPTKEGTKTAVDRLTGQVGIVVKEIENQKNTGQVRVSGEIWSARSKDGNNIKEDTKIEVLQVDGVKAIVKEVEKGE